MILANPVYRFDQIKILVTSECNINCTHCFRADKRSNEKLSNEKLLELIDFAANNQTRRLSFSGGEFFTHDFAYHLLDYCIRKDLEVTILTNAIDVNLKYFKACKARDKISFQVSIDGLRIAHDSRRGEGNFDKTMSNVISLFQLGYKITASMVMDVHNYRDIIKVLDIPFFNSFNCLPVAYMNTEIQKLNAVDPATIEEYNAVISMLYKRDTQFCGADYRCHMFPYGLGIRYDGNVYPCAVARDYDLFCMGNISDKTIDEVIESFLRTPEGKAILSYEKNDIQKCNSCEANKICNRGCRIRAYKFFGDLLEPDLFCCRIFNQDSTNISLNRLFWGELL